MTENRRCDGERVGRALARRLVAEGVATTAEASEWLRGWEAASERPSSLAPAHSTLPPLAAEPPKESSLARGHPLAPAHAPLDRVSPLDGVDVLAGGLDGAFTSPPDREALSGDNSRPEPVPVDVAQKSSSSSSSR